MSKASISLEINTRIFEAQRCLAVAEEEIKVPVGQIGEINLSVCSDCKPKFIGKYP
jgi:hypothetical protein